jgi:hypothetical protein
MAHTMNTLKSKTNSAIMPKIAMLFLSQQMRQAHRFSSTFHSPLPLCVSPRFPVECRPRRNHRRMKLETIALSTVTSKSKPDQR